MTPEPILRFGRCVVRPYYPGDVESLTKAANNPKIARWMQNAFPQPYTADDARAWITIATSPSPLRDFAICTPDSSAVIGGIGLKARSDIHYRTMEVGYWLGEDSWSQGIATEVVSGFSDWAFDAFSHVLRLEAEVFEGNVRSSQLLEKTGFEFEGRRRKAVEKAGVVMDALMYVKLRPES